MPESSVPPRYSIRALTPDEVAAYRALRLASIVESPASVLTTYAAESAIALATLRARLLHTPFQRIFGAFDNGQDGAPLIGMACFKREPIAVVHDRALLWGVYVAPAARRQGVACALLLAAMTHARSYPELRMLDLNVADHNHGARELYQRLGFVATDVRAQPSEQRLSLRVSSRFAQCAAPYGNSECG